MQLESQGIKTYERTVARLSSTETLIKLSRVMTRMHATQVVFLQSLIY